MDKDPSILEAADLIASEFEDVEKAPTRIYMKHKPCGEVLESLTSIWAMAHVMTRHYSDCKTTPVARMLNEPFEDNEEV